MAKLRVDKIAASGQTSENTGSVYFDGSGDYFDISKAPFQFLHKLTHAWTVECWFYKTSDAQGTLFDTGGSSDTAIGTAVYINTGGDIRLRVRQALSGTVVSEDNAGAVSLNTWHHFALTFDGQVIRTFIDGAIISTVNYSTQSSTDSTQTLKIGVYEFDGTSKGGYFQGYISNFRICKGHAVYTSNFVVPTRELEVHQGPDDDRTVLLCCYDGENIFADKSGRHIIAAYGDRTSSPTPTATDSPIGITTNNPGLTRSVDVTDGPVFQGGAGYTSRNWLTLPKGTTTDRNRTGGRGVLSGGTSPNDNTATNNIDYITIATLGNSQDFGDTTESLSAGSSGSDSTRGLFSGGNVAGNNTNYNTISYITIATTSNAVNFGDLSGVKRYTGSTSDKTRTVIAGGANAPGPLTNVIEYVTTQALGNATNFGDLSTATWAFAGTASSPTRGIYFGGSPGPSSGSVNTIVYVTVQTLGDALDFGDLTNANAYTGPGGIVSSSTRGIRGGGGGQDPFTRVNTIDYVTMASTGNAQDFGDLSYTPNGAMGCSSLTRGIFAGGKTPAPASVNNIEYVTIASTGNAQDFGDMRGTYAFSSALSDCHGGIS